MMLRLFLTLIVLSVFALTVVQSYWSHKHEVELKNKVTKLLHDPLARPDSWTGTLDDERTMQMCRAIRLIAIGHKYQAEIGLMLPDVCNQVKEK